MESKTKVAIIHYWIINMRGGEKVLEELCRIFPQADIFTHCYDPAVVASSEILKKHTIKTSFISKLPRATHWYKNYLPLMPMALEQLDLRGYDLIISSESGPAKGIIPPPGALHICYCHSPMRYIWNMYQDYQEKQGFLKRLLMAPLCHYLRMWDVSTTARVDYFVANSFNVGKRIQKYYGRKTDTVIYPPVDIEQFEYVPDSGDFYLMVGELVAYKRPELAVQACNELGRRLVVIGGGEMLEEIRKMAGPTVKVMGSQPFDILKWHYGRCKGLIFPGAEDFGIVPVEAMASGRPVIAFKAGGALETVQSVEQGLFFTKQTVDSLKAVILEFESIRYDPKIIRQLVERFTASSFRNAFISFAQEGLSKHK